MQDTQLKILYQALSSERLEAYRLRNDDDSEVITRYLWNIALSEALYPALQCLEVALRNSIHNTISAAWNNPSWFESSAMKLLDADKVAAAKQTLARQGKPIEPGRIVAELPFGFWTGLLNVPYESILWQEHLVPTFPNVPKSDRTRAKISRRLHGVRQLRNRIFHHEPVWHWQDLSQKHADVVEAIAWISPELQELVRGIDRFPQIYAAGIAPHRRTVKS